MLVSRAAAKKYTNATTGSSKRCVHIFLPRLPLHYWQEPLPLRSCTGYAERSDRGKGKVRSSIHGATSGAEVLS